MAGTFIHDSVSFPESSASEPAKDPPTAKPSANLRQPRHLDWHVDAKVENGLLEAQKLLDQTIADSDVGLLHFSEFGSDAIKKDGEA